MILKYISSNGNTFDLKVGHLRMRTADFHTYEWEPQAVQQQYGERPYRFDRAAVTYSAELSVFGTMEEKKTYLNLLHASFDHDVISNTPGRIAHGAYEIECYIISSSTHYERPYIYNEISIYCPHPFWVREKLYKLEKIEQETGGDYLDFPYDFPFDYKRTLSGYEVIANSGEKAAAYKMIIYGPASWPKIMIGNTEIGARVNIGPDERIEISSRDKTVIRKGLVDESIFNTRWKEKPMFEPIASGENVVTWSGGFRAELTVYEERSEPLWI